MSVRVFGTSVVVSLSGVSCVGASEGGGASSIEYSEGVLFVRGVEVLVSGGGGGGVVGARNKRGRSPSTCWRAPLPPPQPAEVRVGVGAGVGMSDLGEVGGVC